MKISYYAIFEYAEDGINVTFPDLPNAFTCGFSKRHAKKMAKEVLTLVLHGLRVSDLAIARTKKTVSGVCTREQESVRISVRMKVKNGVLFGKNVVELMEENSNSSQKK